jgi:hypothetical protein
MSEKPVRTGVDLKVDPKDEKRIRELFGQGFDESQKNPEKYWEEQRLREDKTPPYESLKLEKSGPFVGPKGGLWADPEHTQHWSPERLSGALDSWAAQLGGKVVPHKSNPGLVVVKIPHAQAAALAAFKQSEHIESPIIPGGKYLLLMLPKSFTPGAGHEFKAAAKNQTPEVASPKVAPPAPAEPDPVSGSVPGTARPKHQLVDHFTGAAESLEEAHGWAAKHLPHLAVRYPDLATANAANKALSEQHPLVVAHLHFLGTPEQLKKWAKAHPEENHIALSGKHPIDLTQQCPLGGSAIAVAHPYDQKPYQRSVMVVGPDYFNEGYAKATQGDSHFTTGHGLISTIRHECGHVEGFVLRHLFAKGSKLSCWEIWKKHCVPQLKQHKNEIMSQISDYAATNPHECYAEVSAARREGKQLPLWVRKALAEMQIDTAQWGEQYHG